MQIDAIRELYDYNHWANQRVLSAMTPLTDDMFTRNMGNSFVSLRDSSPISLARNGFGWSDGLDDPLKRCSARRTSPLCKPFNGVGQQFG